jgi:hypothetical protein
LYNPACCAVLNIRAGLLGRKSEDVRIVLPLESKKRAHLELPMAAIRVSGEAAFLAAISHPRKRESEKQIQKRSLGRVLCNVVQDLSEVKNPPPFFAIRRVTYQSNLFNLEPP